MKLRTLSKSGFIKEFSEVSNGMHPRKFCFILGAGASVSSGIKSGKELVAIWETELRDRYGAEHEKWKTGLGITQENQASFYSQYYEARFPVPLDGYSYLENEIEKASPGAGYSALAYLLCETKNNIVLTTNFDRLVEGAVSRRQKTFPLVIGHEALAHYIVDDAKRPIIIKIHRDLLMDPKNRADEIRKLDDRWVKHLEKVFRNYHPVFIGYDGNDRSLMDYLSDNLKNFQTGVWKFPYWTLHGSAPISGKKGAFMEAAGGYVIYGCDFDDLMIRLGDAFGYKLQSEEDAVKEAREENRRIRDKMNAVLQMKSGTELLPPSPGAGSGSTQEASVKAPDASEAAADSETLNDAISRITDDSADSRSARYRQAVIAFNDGHYKKAEALLRQLVGEEPGNARYHDSLSTTLHKMRKYEQAVAESLRAVELEPGNALYHDNLGNTLHKMKKYEQAVAEKRRAIELEPDNARYHNSLGVTLHEIEKYEQAEVESLRAVELEPDNARYHDSLGITLHNMKKYEQAVAEKRRAVELEPDNAEYHDSLAITLLAQKKNAEAAIERKKAEELREKQVNGIQP